MYLHSWHILNDRIGPGTISSFSHHTGLGERGGWGRERGVGENMSQSHESPFINFYDYYTQITADLFVFKYEQISQNILPQPTEQSLADVLMAVLQKCILQCLFSLPQSFTLKKFFRSAQQNNFSCHLVCTTEIIAEKSRQHLKTMPSLPHQKYKSFLMYKRHKSQLPYSMRNTQAEKLNAVH